MSKPLYTPANTKNNPRGSNFHIVRPNEPLGPQVINLVSTAPDKTIIVAGGGNKGLSADLAAGLPAFISGAFKGFRGVIISGGTWGGKYEITTVAPQVAAENDDCIAIGFTPVTDQPTLSYDDGSVILNKYGNTLDAGHHMNVLVSPSPSAKYLDWNGDLEQRFVLLEELRDQGYNVVYMLLNGGAVTAEEIYMSIERRLNVVAVNGYGREVDLFVQQLASGKIGDLSGDGKPVPADLVAARQALLDGLDHSLVTVTQAGDSAGLRNAFIANGTKFA